MTQPPTEEVSDAMAFYATLGLDVSYFGALWHTFNVGHILATDLDRVCRRHALSVADFNLLGALRIERAQPLRPTDLAATLQVSHAALSTRIARLAQVGLITRSPALKDRRASTLELTPVGARLVDTIHAAIETESQFVRQFHRLAPEDRAQLARIMGRLHTNLDREFLRSFR